MRQDCRSFEEPHAKTRRRKDSLFAPSRLCVRLFFSEVVAMNLFAAFLVLGLLETPSIRLHGVIDGKKKASFEVAGLDANALDALAKGKREPAEWNVLF